MEDYINIHTHKNNYGAAFAIYNKNLEKEVTDKINFSVGIHPWFITEKNLPEQLKTIEKELQKRNCLALGEIGLDKLTKTDFELQQSVFKAQLNLNKKVNKPVILHVVKAFQQIIAITKNYGYPYIIHGFTKKLPLAKQLINKGFYLSFGKQLLYNESLQLVFKTLPLNRIFLETDDASISIKELYKKAADIKEISLESVILAMKNNFETVFTCKKNG